MTIDEILAERDEYQEQTGIRYTYGEYYALFVAGRPKELHKAETKKYSHRVYRGTARIAKKFTAEELEQIKEEYLSGSTTTVIAEKFRSTAPTVRKRLKEMGVFDRARDYGAVWSDEDDKQLRELYLKGCSVPEIAAIMNRTKKAVSVRISHSGLVKIKKRLEKEKDRCETAISTAAKQN